MNTIKWYIIAGPCLLGLGVYAMKSVGLHASVSWLTWRQY